MKKWEIENLEKSEISEKLFRVFLFSSFQSFPTAKIQSSDLKISEKNSRDFRGFQVSCEYYEIFKNTYFKEHLGDDCILNSYSKEH